jgi:HEAT repeat protein
MLLLLSAPSAYAGENKGVKGHLLKQLKDASQEIREKAADDCVQMGARAVPTLIAAIKTKEVITMVSCEDECSQGWEASNALTKIGIPAVPFIVAALKDHRPAVRAQAVTTLGNMGVQANSAIPVLIKALKDSDHWVRLSTANALGKQGPAAQPAIPSLIKTLMDPRANVRTYSASALGDIGPVARPAIPALRQALKDSDGYVRGAAADALVKIESK